MNEINPLRAVRAGYVVQKGERVQVESPAIRYRWAALELLEQGYPADAQVFATLAVSAAISEAHDDQ